MCILTQVCIAVMPAAGSLASDGEFRSVIIFASSPLHLLLYGAPVLYFMQFSVKLNDRA